MVEVREVEAVGVRAVGVSCWLVMVDIHSSIRDPTAKFTVR